MSEETSASMGGYTCAACGQWCVWGFSHFCPSYPNPYVYPQIVYTNIIPNEVAEKIDRILEELQEIKELLK
jgi:hypothetical protein